MKRVLLFVGLAAILVVGLVVLDFALLHGRTPAIGSALGVASLEKVRLNGVDQWVLIRGADRTKPVLLFLHGGPGMPAMFLAHAFQRELERDFVVVHWDRRGAGKSFDARVAGQALTVSQTLEDARDLTNYLKGRFSRARIYLVGHSWGSYLGLLAVRAHPGDYEAFVGMGQMAGTREQVRALRRAFLSKAAREAGDSKLIARASSPSLEVTEDDLFRFGGELYASRSFWPILATGLGAPEYTFRDAMNVKKGSDLVGREMKNDVLPRPLEGEISRLDVPVFFFLGRHDFNTPSELAAEYLARLDAPLKETVWFERSAHFPFFEEPELFYREMVRMDAAVSRFWRAGRTAEGVPKS